MDSLSQPLSNKTFLDLNDDCIREVLKYLNQWDLCAIADVCKRLKKNARDHLTSVKSRNLRTLHLGTRTHIFGLLNTVNHSIVSQSLLTVSNYLRHFGAYIESISVDQCFGWDARYNHKGCFTEIIKLLARHCGGTLIELELCNYGFKITTHVAEMFRPLLTGLRILTTRETDISGTFLRMLPLWSPELKELKLEKSQTLFPSGFNQNFPKLESVSFLHMKFVKFANIEEMLKNNPQLKRIEISGTQNIDKDDIIIRLIAQHSLQAEEITIKLSDRAFNVKNIECIGNMSKLRSLHICGHVEPSLIAVAEIAAANIPLENLQIEFPMNLRSVSLIISACRKKQRFNQILEETSKLKKLKKLSLTRAYEIELKDFLVLCTKLEELSEIELIHTSSHILTWENILQIVQHGENLQILRFEPHGNVKIDIDKYKQILNIVENRQSRKTLEINFATNIHSAEIPRELIKAVKINDASNWTLYF